MLMKLMKARSRKQLRLLTVSGRFVLHFNYRWARTKTLIRIAPDFGSASLSFAVWTSFQCLIFLLFCFSFWFYSRCSDVFGLFQRRTGLSGGQVSCCHKSHQGFRGIIWQQEVLIDTGVMWTRFGFDKHFCDIYPGRLLHPVAFWQLSEIGKYSIGDKCLSHCPEFLTSPQPQIWLMIHYHRAFFCNTGDAIIGVGFSVCAYIISILEFLVWWERKISSRYCVNNGKPPFHSEGSEALAQAAQRSCGCFIPGVTQGQVGWPMAGACNWVVFEVCSIPTQTTLWFYSILECTECCLYVIIVFTWFNCAKLRASLVWCWQHWN